MKFGFHVPILNRRFGELNPLLCGQEKCCSGHTAYGNRNYYLIHYVENGRGTLISSRGEFRVGRGQIFIIYPHESAIYRADTKEPWHYVWIGFDGKMAERLDALDSPVWDFPATAFSLIKSLADRPDTREEVAAAALYLIFADLFSGKLSSRPQYVKQTIDMINTLYMQTLTVGGIAQSLGLDRRYLARLFKADTGMSVQEYLISVRMEQAKRLLRDGIPVNQTANLVGYTDCFNFSKMFKKQYTVSPKHYAMTVRENEKNGIDSDKET